MTFAWMHNTLTDNVSPITRALNHADETEKLSKNHVYVNVTAYNSLLKRVFSEMSRAKQEKAVDECTIMTIDGLNEVARSKTIPPAIVARPYVAFDNQNDIVFKPASQSDSFAVCNALVFVKWVMQQRKKFGDVDMASNLPGEIHTSFVGLKVRVTSRPRITPHVDQQYNPMRAQ